VAFANDIRGICQQYPWHLPCIVSEIAFSQQKDAMTFPKVFFTAQYRWFCAILRYEILKKGKYFRF
jgi:hypothetical protein